MIDTPKEAQKQFCRECLGGRIEADCQGNEIQCPFYKYRKKEGHVPVKAHRKNCLLCMGGSYELVDGCETEDCACPSYRFGKAPNQSDRRPCHPPRQLSVSLVAQLGEMPFCLQNLRDCADHLISVRSIAGHRSAARDPCCRRQDATIDPRPCR